MPSCGRRQKHWPALLAVACSSSKFLGFGMHSIRCAGRGTIPKVLTRNWGSRKLELIILLVWFVIPSLPGVFLGIHDGESWRLGRMVHTEPFGTGESWVPSWDLSLLIILSCRGPIPHWHSSKLTSTLSGTVKERIDW
ncbi:uncharacterized protein BJX67DRAFT_182667 [Aspergillus lucknowensis]|uniref:Uncharacterized protein n=1 Tax=Aspergillus lucknowensis TaxID=176173 RepID=A0ABR4LLE1_9EURO